MNAPLSTQWSFRPAQMPEEMFVKTFIGREEEMENIFSHIRFHLIPTLTQGSRKNLLIKADRGIGKTSLFLAVKYKLKNQQAHMLDKIIPVFFNEQEDFNTAEKLILRTFQIVADDAPVFDSLAHPGEWKKTYHHIKENIRDALTGLMKTVDGEKKKLVLFIENFDTLAYRVLRQTGAKKERARTRDMFISLVKDPRVLMICSGLETPDTKHDYGAETFREITLEPLKDFYEMILRRARYDNNLFLLANKEKLRNKIKAFEYLTGGNTRLMVHLYECLVEKDINKLELMLNDMINKSTPLFEWILERFVDYESREILNALARRGGNATIKEIAADTYNSESSVRTLMNRLRKKQFVEKIDKEKRDKSDIYIMTPMMFFIWYQKSVLQSKDVILDFFIHFVDLFFDPTQMTDRPYIEQVRLSKEEDENELFSPYFNYVKKFIDAGKFPLKSADEKREDEPSETDAENEKMVYEVVRARKDDTVLKTQIHKAFSLKVENKPGEAADLFRVAARGYLILVELTEGSFIDRAEENIRRAIEIYQSVKTEPLETVRCMLILVEILSDTERKEELKLFAQNIIRIGKKAGGEAFATYLGNAHKYLGFAETDAEKKLEHFQAALGYFEKDISQTVIILLNIGLTYKSGKQYEPALEIFERAFELSRGRRHFDHLNSIISSITGVYYESKDYRGGASRIEEILSLLEEEHESGINYMALYSSVGIFFLGIADFFKAEKYLRKGVELADKADHPPSKILILSSLSFLYDKSGKKQKTQRTLKEIEAIATQEPNLESSILISITERFKQTRFFKGAISIYARLYQRHLETGDIEAQFLTLLKIGTCYTELKDHENAGKYFGQAKELARQNKRGTIRYSGIFSYAISLGAQGRIDEAITELEALDKLTSPPDSHLHILVKKALFQLYMEKSQNAYCIIDPSGALTYARKGLKYINYVPTENFVQGFYFRLVLELIEQYGKQVSPFLEELKLCLSEYYDDKEKGDYAKIFGHVTELVKGKDFNKITKDLPPDLRNLLALVKEKLEKDEILKEAEKLVEDKKFDKVAELLEKSLRNNNKNIRKLRMLAKVYEQNSQEKAYVETLKRTLNLYPDDSDTIYDLALYYAMSGQKDEAEKLALSSLNEEEKEKLSVFRLGLKEKARKNYSKAAEYLSQYVNCLPEGDAKMTVNLALVETYLNDWTPQSAEKVEQILESMRHSQSGFQNGIPIYLPEVILSMLTRDQERLKSSLASVLFMYKDLPISFTSTPLNVNWDESLEKNVGEEYFDCITHIERMLTGCLPISSFVEKFDTLIDPKMVNDISSELQTSGAAAFKQFMETDTLTTRETADLCGSRIRLESFLHHLKGEFFKLPPDKQSRAISFMKGVLDELPEAYNWLVLDFCSEHLLELVPGQQGVLIDALLERLDKKEESELFLKETTAFLQTAGNLVDAPLKEKIQKKLIDINTNQTKEVTP